MPEGITGRELDAEIHEELRALSKETAERVAKHLVAAGALAVEGDVDAALEHARYAASRGGRVGAVREAYGVLAYQTGDFATAIKELRTAIRISGRTELLTMVADCQRGLGRPERALDIAASPEAESLSAESTIEMMIVVAGAYSDIGDIPTALATLEIPALRSKVNGRWQVRLWVAYADLLMRDGRDEEAQKWLRLAADADTERLGRPAPVEPMLAFESDEQISVIDAQIEDEDDSADAGASEKDPGRDETETRSTDGERTVREEDTEESQS